MLISSFTKHSLVSSVMLQVMAVIVMTDQMMVGRGTETSLVMLMMILTRRNIEETGQPSPRISYMSLRGHLKSLIIPMCTAERSLQ